MLRLHDSGDIKTMLVKEAKALGNVSTGNSKMPGTTFAIDAFACKTGSKLAKVKGTPCNVCYARKLQKLRPRVDQGWKANLSKYETAFAQGALSSWVQALAFQILRYNTDGYHRWFDSGDLQSANMLDAICQVCRLTPKIRHWLPTQERRIVNEYFDSHPRPSNLVVRVSASKIDGALPSGHKHTSNVFTSADHIRDQECEARKRGNKCGPCRACWSEDVRNVSYPKH